MRSQGEAENLICSGVNQILHGAVGRGPARIRCHIFEDMVTVRCWNKFTFAENQLILGGKDILKDYRKSMLMSVSDSFLMLIRTIFDIELVNFHHDITLTNGEEVLIFSLESVPAFRILRGKIHNGKLRVV